MRKDFGDVIKIKNQEVAKWAQSNSVNSQKLRQEAESFNARSTLPISALKMEKGGRAKKCGGF